MTGIVRNEVFLTKELMLSPRLELYAYEPMLTAVYEEQISGEVGEPLRNLILLFLDIIDTPVDCEVPEHEYPCMELAPRRKLVLAPGAHIRRKLVRFTKDKENEQTRKKKCKSTLKATWQMVSESYEHKEAELQCKNDHNVVKHQTPGEFVFSCHHGIILGVIFLTEVESVRHPYSFLAERLPKQNFKNTFLVFDNSCRLATHIMHRHVDLFDGLRLATDSFHTTTSHKSCPKSTHVQFWKPLFEKYGLDLKQLRPGQGISTSTAESINSQLRSMAKSIQYSNMSTHIAYITQFVTLRNLVKKGIIMDCTRTGKSR